MEGRRKQKVLFLCTQNSARSQMAEGFLRHLAGDRFEVMSAGLEATDEVHPCAVEAMMEVGVDISGQRPKGLSTYMGKEYFNYLIIVCARAEERCPKTFPSVGTTFSWVFEDPRRDEDLPYDSMLERFRAVRDGIELRMRGWLERPEAELKGLREEREGERRERLEASERQRGREAKPGPGPKVGTPSAVPEGPRIELLYFDGCPTYLEAERFVRKALADEGIEADVEMVAVNTDEEARRLRFPGSPTIRVDGRDLFPVPDRKSWRLGCRIYVTPEGLKGSPTAEMLRAALE